MQLSARCAPVPISVPMSSKPKLQFIERDGLKFGVRTLEDVERVAKLCGMFPQLTNLLFQNKLTAELLKSATGIHQERQIPLFPTENFPQWAIKA